MDDINKKLDELEENGDYKGMVELLMTLPNDRRTLELAFVLISALVNFGDYKSAVTQLRGIFPLCKEPKELAQLYYYSGYAVTQLGGNPALGLSLMKEALVYDPKDELGLEIEQECRDCVDKFNAGIEQFHKLCIKAADVIHQKASEAKESGVLKGRELLAKMSFLNVFRLIPTLDEPLDPEGNDKPLVGEKREKLANWLSSAIGFTDHESLIKMFSESKIFNVSSMVNDAVAFIEGTPNFDPEVLDRRSRDFFGMFTVLVRCFADLMPPAGVLGWDIAKRTAVARSAYIAGIISEDEYCELTNELLNAAESFSGPADFLLSLVFGSALAAYDAENHSVMSACAALDLTMNETVECGLFGSTFIFD